MHRLANIPRCIRSLQRQLFSTQKQSKSKVSVPAHLKQVHLGVRWKSSSSSDSSYNEQTDWNNPVENAALSDLDGFEESMDTIFHVSTGMNNTPVAISIVRISGPLALPVLALLTGKPSSHVMQYTPRKVQNGDLFSVNLKALRAESMKHMGVGLEEQSVEQVKDQIYSLGCVKHLQDQFLDSRALLLPFHGPKSFTGEDLVELHVHGNPLITRELLKTLSNQPHCRIAVKGEFTRRAFLNKKLDLLEVEGVHNQLHSTTLRQHNIAGYQASGEMSALFQAWRKELIGTLAYCESIVDFGEDEADVAEQDQLANVLPRVLHQHKTIQSYLNTQKRAELIQTGVRMSIVGSPNAGKSSLLNALARRDVAIVSSIPGTTRDVVSVGLDIDGFQVNIYDTAGLRASTDVVEFVGVQKAFELANQVDLRLLQLDGEMQYKPIKNQLKMKHKLDIAHLDDIEQRHMDELVLLIQNAVPSMSKRMISKNTIILITKADTWDLNQVLVKKKLATQQTVDPNLHHNRSIASKELEDTEKARKDHMIADLALAFEEEFQMTPILAHKKAKETLDQVLRTDVTEELKDETVLLDVPLSRLMQKAVEQAFPQIVRACVVSSKAKWGIDRVMDHVVTEIKKNLPQDDEETSLVVFTARHKRHVESTKDALDKFLHCFHINTDTEVKKTWNHVEDLDLVLATEYLRIASQELGKVTGKVHVEELLDVIFNDFCIGK